MALRRVRIDGTNVTSNMGGRRKPCAVCGETAVLTKGEDGVERCDPCGTRKSFADRPQRRQEDEDRDIREAFRNQNRRK